MEKRSRKVPFEQFCIILIKLYQRSDINRREIQDAQVT